MESSTDGSCHLYGNRHSSQQFPGSGGFAIRDVGSVPRSNTRCYPHPHPGTTLWRSIHDDPARRWVGCAFQLVRSLRSQTRCRGGAHRTRPLDPGGAAAWDHEKLNQSYLYGNPGFGYYEGPGAGPGLMARTLALNFGVVPERYIGVNMRTFEDIVNAVGGIDVYLPKAVDGRTEEDRAKRLVFPAGQQHLNGPQALTLARIRIDGVFDRMDHQNLVMCALKEKLTSPKVITSIPALITSFKENVQTDLTPEQLTQLACIGSQIKSENIIFASFPEELFTQTRIYDPVFKGRVFIWDVDFNIIRDYVKRFNEGTWPDPNADEEDPITITTCQ